MRPRAQCPPLDQGPIPLPCACRYVRCTARRLLTASELVDHYATHSAYCLCDGRAQHVRMRAHRGCVHGPRAGYRAPRILQRADRRELPDIGLRLYARRPRVRRLSPGAGSGSQDVQRGPRLRTDTRPVGQVRQVRRHRALYLAVRNGAGGFHGRDDSARSRRSCRSQIPAVRQPLRRARAHAE